MENPVETTKDKESLVEESKHEKEKTNEQLEKEIQQLRLEFNTQRAKMKEMYMNKEGECQKLSKDLNDLRQTLEHSKVSLDAETMIQDLQDQHRRAQEEIQNLQTIVNETVDESVNAQNYAKRLYDENERLKQEVNQLRENVTSLENNSFAPVLTQVKKTILGKLGTSETNDNMEDSMRKAHEDAEVLRSLVVPLEEEIKHLKEKLRDAHEQIEQQSAGKSSAASESALVGMLNDTRSASPNNPQESATSAAVKKSASFICEMCANYETKLVQCQEEAKKSSQCNSELTKELQELKEDLSKEIALRLDLDKQCQEKREKHKEEVEVLTAQVKKTEDLFHQLIKTYNEMKEGTNQEMLKLTAERERIYHHLENLQKDNDFLSGKYLTHSQELKDEEIDLPQNIDELNELVLKLHEDLIVSKSATEYAEAKYLSYQDEANLLRDQLLMRDRERQAMERELTNRIQTLEEQLTSHEEYQKQLLHEKSELERKELEYKKQISESQMQIIELSAAKEKFEKVAQEYRTKASVLQQELANNEAVQKDFVKLSQSLQMQLEKIRSENTQVRWQDEDEADNCAQCKRDFTVTRRKHHCRHCGTIFCDNCLQKNVPSRNGQKKARVCDVCYTLLVSSSAPYFSQEPPNSP
ncbi:rab GTPase-binding effector protein 2 isoform X2 [Culicoides brevitarsis]|uniref:rab GTPase-binding effector protein 2 isoform X2 n=1 Tax=Culicoides brevitarsis TaxID=469753 RepID=UPI00307C18C7